MIFGIDKIYLNKILMIAIPISIQNILQSSLLSFTDQLMIGQLGSPSVAGIGIATKFISIFSVVISAISTAIAIIIAQNIGQQDEGDVNEGFWTGVLAALSVALMFFGATVCFPEKIMTLYTNDPVTVSVASEYIRIFSVSFFMMAAAMMAMTMLRCLENTRVIMISGFVSAAVNIILSYTFIFGKFGIEPMGTKGAALGTIFGHLVNFLILTFTLRAYCKKTGKGIPFGIMKKKSDWIPFIKIFIPIITGGFLWSLGDNVYTAVYGHIGTMACAAMTLTLPLQGVVLGAIKGIVSASGVIVSKTMGSGDFDTSYSCARKNIIISFAAALAFSIFVFSTSNFYPLFFKVEAETRALTHAIIRIYAVFAPIKMLFFTIQSGVLKCGGKIGYSFVTDMISTWMIGVPLAFICAFVLELPITAVYTVVCLSEIIMLVVSLFVFRSKKWMAVLPD